MSVRFIFLIITVLFFAACKKSDDVPTGTNVPDEGHPRILLLKGEEQQIQDLIDNDETWKHIHYAILDECNRMLGKLPVENVLIGRRLLDKSRECLRRVFYLSYAYRMTKDEHYLKRAEAEMLAVSRFSDWNPSHFLDVAEMTMACAIGYDWLFTELSENARKEIRSAILTKGINPSKGHSYNWFLTSENNWNQVCNAGMVFGALAIQEDYPDLTTEIVDRAFNSIKLPMKACDPDGVYPEGYGYWGYGTTFNVLFLSAVNKFYGDDRGLASTPGFLESANFMENMLGPNGKSFNWSDCGTNANLNPGMFWFAQYTNNPSVLWSELRFLDSGNISRLKGLRELPALLIWAKNISLSQITPPEKTVWMGQGENPVCLMRTSWTDPLAIYLGFKAGTPSVNHGHMDIGSFVMDADGVRWTSDLGMQNYESLESKGMSIFGKTQDAQRWTIFRMNNYSHNTLTVNNELQRVDGYAKIDKYSDAENFSFAVSDISSVYNGQLKKATRGVGIVDKSYVVVRDELEAPDNPTTVRWNMVTYANVALENKQATLTLNGKQLVMKVQGPDNLVMKTWSTAPTNNYDAENPGTIMVGFECELPANAKDTFEVLLVPEKALASATFTNKTLTNW